MRPKDPVLAVPFDSSLRKGGVTPRFWRALGTYPISPALFPVVPPYGKRVTGLVGFAGAVGRY